MVGYCCAPSRSLNYVVFSRFDEGGERIILRGLVLLFPLLLFKYSIVLTFGRLSGGSVPTGYHIVLPPLFLLILLILLF